MNRKKLADGRRNHRSISPAATTPCLSPSMNATLRVYPVTFDQTQRVLGGEYQPFLGFLERAFGALIGHEATEVTAQHCVTEVAMYLQENLD